MSTGDLLKSKDKAKTIPATQVLLRPSQNATPIANENETTLVVAMSKYIAFLNNVDVPKHLQRDRSPDYINDISRSFKYFCGCLKKSGYEISSFPLSALSDNEVGIFYQFLEDKNSSPFTFNRYFTYFTSFLSWAQKKGNQVKNVFEDVGRLETETDSRSISHENFERLLPLVTFENGFQFTPGREKEKRNVFRDYLVTAYRLGLLTGRRTEEVITLSFADIDAEEKTIRVEDFKPNRIKKRKGSQKRFVFIPITPQLRSLNDDLGFEGYKKSGVNRYLIAPEIVHNRVATMSDALSRSFTHYYKQVDPNEVLTWKCLRKTYLTKLKIFLQKGTSKIDVKDISNHSSDAVLEKHYFDQRLIAAALADSGFEVFPPLRQHELDRVRSHSEEESRGKDIER